MAAGAVASVGVGVGEAEAAVGVAVEGGAVRDRDHQAHEGKTAERHLNGCAADTFRCLTEAPDSRATVPIFFKAV